MVVTMDAKPVRVGQEEASTNVSNAKSVLHISTQNEGAVLFLTLQGELDLHTVDELRRVIGEGIANPHCTDIVADMQGVSFVDSSGYGTFLNAMQSLRPRSGRVHLAGCVPAVVRMLAIVRLNRVFQIHDTMDEARAAVAGLLTASAPAA